MECVYIGTMELVGINWVKLINLRNSVFVHDGIYFETGVFGEELL